MADTADMADRTGRRVRRAGLAGAGVLVVAMVAGCTQDVDTTIAVTCQHFVPGQGFVTFPSTVAVDATLPVEVAAGSHLTIDGIALSSDDLGDPSPALPQAASVFVTGDDVGPAVVGHATAPPVLVDVSSTVTASPGDTLELSLGIFARTDQNTDELKTVSCTPTGDEPFATIRVVAPRT